MDVAVHLSGPHQKSPKIVALAPHELPKFQKADLLHLDAGIGFDSPQEVGAAPGRETMAFSGIPEKTKPMAHADIITMRL